MSGQGSHDTTMGELALSSFATTHGALPHVRIAWWCAGPADAPPVLVLGGISATRALLAHDDVPGSGWWPGVVGAGRALDPEAYRLVGVDYLAGRGESSRPARSGGWPPVTTADQAAAVLHVLDELGIDRLHAAVGASYGGMVALALAARAPARVARLVALCATHRSHPLANAWRSVQRRVLRLGIERGAAAEAVGIARALAITTYRSADELGLRFRGAPLPGERARLPVDAYLDAHAARYAAEVDAPSLLALSESLDLHDVDPSAIRTPTTLVAFDSDVLVPPAEVRALAGALGERAILHVVHTRFGHDGFLKEAGAVGRIVRAALETPAHAAGPLAVPVSAYAAAADDGAHAAATRAARAGVCTDPQFGAVLPPIHLSTTYSFEGLDRRRRYDYSRSGNPTRDTLAGTIASLEHGAAGLVTASGMAAVTAVLHLLRPGQLLVAAHDGYGGTHRLVTALAQRGAFDLQLADLTAADAPERVRRLRPALLWIETPSNPLLRITDIATLAAAAHEYGGLVVVDNTFLSPALQTPLDHGADVVVHSTTKYLNGHSDVVGGAVVARDAAVAEQVGWWANCLGLTGSPFDSYLTQRGVRTLHARMAVHEANARHVVELLARHEAVAGVHHPSLPTHPGHAIALRQQRGFGAMISFELHGGTAAVERFVAGLRCFTLAESLGGVESLVAHPATMTHASMDEAARRHAGIADTLLRLSVGIEDGTDLLRDLENALRLAGAEPTSRRLEAAPVVPATRQLR